MQSIVGRQYFIKLDIEMKLNVYLNHVCVCIHSFIHSLLHLCTVQSTIHGAHESESNVDVFVGEIR